MASHEAEKLISSSPSSHPLLVSQGCAPKRLITPVPPTCPHVCACTCTHTHSLFTHILTSNRNASTSLLFNKEGLGQEAEGLCCEVGHSLPPVSPGYRYWGWNKWNRWDRKVEAELFWCSAYLKPKTKLLLCGRQVSTYTYMPHFTPKINASRLKNIENENIK